MDLHYNKVKHRKTEQKLLKLNEIEEEMKGLSEKNNPAEKRRKQ